MADTSSTEEARPSPGALRIVPLGGVGEFGKNMAALDIGEDLIVIDCGQMFPREDMFGVDSVIPDFRWIDVNADRLRGVILTHGHEDHIGAIAYFLRDFKTPVYGSELTLELARGKLRDLDVDDDIEWSVVRGGDRVRLGGFEVEFVPVAHSMPHSMALAIRTGAGLVVHTGDYKCDEDNEDSLKCMEAFRRLGEEGVLALMADSTNADREGHSPGERSVVEGLRPVIAESPFAVVLTTFSSALHRVQTVLDLAHELGRKVGVTGLSLERNFGIASRLGLIHYPEGLVVSLQELRRLPRDERVLLITGSQGEATSGLARLAVDDYRGYAIEPEDTVVLSSRMIPGNERPIFRMINNLYRLGARVVTERDARVHASGHAYRDEMRLLIESLRPKYLIPVHGELRNQMAHRELAVETGMDSRQVWLMDNGNALEIGEGRARLERLQLAGQVMVDGKVFDEVEEIVLRDRRNLSEDGIIMAVLVIDSRDCRILTEPEIVTRGFIEVDNNLDLIQECRDVVRDAFEECQKDRREEWAGPKTAVRKALRRYLKHETDRFPVILPVVMEV